MKYDKLLGNKFFQRIFNLKQLIATEVRYKKLQKKIKSCILLRKDPHVVFP